MSIDAMVEAATAVLRQNLTALGEAHDLTTLTPQLAEDISGGLRTALAAAGVAALRAFLQPYDTAHDIVRDAAGEVYRFKEVRPRTFLTAFGTLTVERRCFQNKTDTHSYAPLDAAWGMQGQYLTPAVREAVLFSCALMTPEETVAVMKQCALFVPDATTIKREVVRTGERLEAHRAAIDAAVHAQETPPEATQVLVVSADGATVLMNEAGVSVGRPAERPGPGAPAVTPTAYRVAMVGSVSYYGAPETPGERPPRLQSRYVAHMPEPGCPHFKTLLEAEVDAAHAGLPADTPRILLLDGSRELWHYFTTNPRYDGYERAIDFWHVTQHLATAADALFGAGTKAQAWYEKHYDLLLACDDAARRIQRSIDYYENRYTRSATDAKHLTEERTYFTRNGDRMRYATFRQNGWPIGSGPIEAACKTLIKTRLCRSGMRWTRAGGQRILDLRTYVKSGRWERFWHEIKALERAA